MMKFDFQRYLAAKRTVDDLSLNRPVWEALTAAIEPEPRVVEVACGTGTMLGRMRARGLLPETASYLGFDADCDHIAVAGTAYGGPHVRFECADLFDRPTSEACSLLVAAAFLDLVDLDRALPQLLGYLESGGLGYFPLNFDGLTVFEPPHPLDDAMIAAYHASMDARLTGGQSRTGRRLFQALPEAGFEILAAGASDWVVFAGPDKRYPADEAYFLRYILHFFEGSCEGIAGLDGWLAARTAQIEAGELVYIAHQVDFLVRAG